MADYIKYNVVPGFEYHIKTTIFEGKKVGFWANLTNIINHWEPIDIFNTLPAKVIARDATANFTLASQVGTDGGGRPICCQSNVRINGAASNCETFYYLEVTENNEWWFHNRTIDGADFAGRWFSGQVPSNINLQWFTNTYGNPLNGDPLNGINPTAYAGFTMRERNYPGTPNPNFYRIKLVTFQNGWHEKNILIDVNGSCKTDDFSVFDPSTMTPMSDEEALSLFKNLGNPLTDSAKIEQVLEIKNPTIILYPNPSRGDNVLVTLENEDTKNMKLFITDMTGRTLDCSTEKLNSNTVQLNTQNLVSGLYMVTIFVNDKTFHEKLWIH